MQYTKFGRTGLRVSKLCLGTMTFGLQCDDTQSHAILDAAAEGGIDFLDSADVYPVGGGPTTAGRTEEIVGAWLKGKRQQFILATKCVGQMGSKPWDQGMSRKHILDAIDASLRRLGTDYIDLYQLHGYDSGLPLMKRSTLSTRSYGRARRGTWAFQIGRRTRLLVLWAGASSRTFLVSSLFNHATICCFELSNAICCRCAMRN